MDQTQPRLLVTDILRGFHFSGNPHKTFSASDPILIAPKNEKNWIRIVSTKNVGATAENEEDNMKAAFIEEFGPTLSE